MEAPNSQLSSYLLAQPVCDSWGMTRGVPVDRYYVDAFLSRHAADIRGHVLEIGDAGYSRRFGGTHVSRTDVLDVDPNNMAATIISDLCNAPHIATDTFDCIILTQVLVLIPDLRAAIDTLVRILKSGGVILSTHPAISRVSSVPREMETWCWSIYPPSARWLFTRPDVDHRTLLVEGYGNLRTATAFLWGLAQEDLTESDFLQDDPRYPIITAVRASKK
jgi:SAM-dependent methyltransferase